jgi:DNA-binding LacI/PurR family transcriptional regulator
MPLNDPGMEEILKKLPQEKTYILDLGYKDWGSKYPSVCQYYEEDIYEGFHKVKSKLKKYSKIVFVTGRHQHYKLEFAYKGIIRFCKEAGFKYATKKTFDNYMPVKGNLYIVVDDADLVYLIKKTMQHPIKLGKDIGIISYNETPFKEIVGNGIATISTDFTQMGKSIINMIFKKGKTHIKNPSRIIERGSF